MFLMVSKEVEEIIQSVNYVSPSRYISGRIIEYDIRSANVSMLREANAISQEEYENLMRMPKVNREIEIGLREKEDLSIYTTIAQGIRTAKLRLADSNNIQNPDCIVRVANDAVYINSPVDLKYTRFGDYIEFKKKSEIHNMINLNKIIVFLSVLPDGNINVDVKGIGNNIGLHSEYMINIIVSTITMLEYSGVDSAINYISHICEDYLLRRLPVGFYREFTPESSYRIATQDYFLSSIGPMQVSENDKYLLDINYNYNILRELWSILIDIYNRRKW